MPELADAKADVGVAKQLGDLAAPFWAKISAFTNTDVEKNRQGVTEAIAEKSKPEADANNSDEKEVATPTPVPIPPATAEILSLGYVGNQCPFRAFNGDEIIRHVGGSPFKNRGLLGKAGEYVTPRSPPKYTLLLRKGEEIQRHPDNPFPSYKTEWFTCTFEKKEREDLEAFMRTGKSPGRKVDIKYTPFGLCPHTLKEWVSTVKSSSESNTGKPASFPAKFSAVCQRLECCALPLSKLVDSYLTLPGPADKWEMLVQAFRGKMEPLVAVPGGNRAIISQGKLSHEDRYVVGNVSPTKIQYTAKSKGTIAYEFSIYKNADSTVERLKNSVRPIAMRGKRRSTHRQFVVQSFAHNDKDALKRWQKTIIKALNPADANDQLLAECAEEIDLANFTTIYKKDKMEDTYKACFETHQGFRHAPEILPSDKSKWKRESLVMFRDIDEAKGYGIDVIRAEMDTPLDILDAFLAMAPLDETAGHELYDSKFDACIVPTIPGTNGSIKTTLFRGYKMTVTNDGTNGSLSSKYGQDVQTAVVNINLEGEELPRKGPIGWFARTLIGDLLSRKTEAQVLTTKLRRYFYLKKSHFTTTRCNERLKDFCIRWESTSDEGKFSFINKTGQLATLNRVLVRVEDLCHGSPCAKEAIREEIIGMLEDGHTVFKDHYNKCAWFLVEFIRNIDILVKGSVNDTLYLRLLNFLKAFVALPEKLRESDMDYFALINIHAAACDILPKILDYRLRFKRINPDVLEMLSITLEALNSRVLTTSMINALKKVKEFGDMVVHTVKQCDGLRAMFTAEVFKNMEESCGKIEALMDRSEFYKSFYSGKMNNDNKAPIRRGGSPDIIHPRTTNEMRPNDPLPVNFREIEVAVSKVGDALDGVARVTSKKTDEVNEVAPAGAIKAIPDEGDKAEDKYKAYEQAVNTVFLSVKSLRSSLSKNKLYYLNSNVQGLLIGHFKTVMEQLKDVRSRVQVVFKIRAASVWGESILEEFPVLADWYPDVLEKMESELERLSMEYEYE